MQGKPIKPTLKPIEMKRLKLKCYEMFPTFACKLNLRRYITVSGLGEGITVPATLTHLNESPGEHAQLVAGAHTRPVFSSI